MIYFILGSVLVILFVISIIFDFVVLKKESKPNFIHDSNQVEKWIFVIDKTFLFRVNGDFWVSYNSKSKLPYCLNCGRFNVKSYESEEDCRIILHELTDFLSDEQWKIYTVL